MSFHKDLVKGLVSYFVEWTLSAPVDLRLEFFIICEGSEGKPRWVSQ